MIIIQKHVEWQVASCRDEPAINAANSNIVDLMQIMFLQIRSKLKKK